MRQQTMLTQQRRIDTEAVQLCVPTHVLFLCRNKYVSAVEDTEVLYLHILISLAYNTAEKGY